MAVALNVAPYMEECVTRDEQVVEWMKALGGELATARKDKDISQEEMAELLGMGRSTIYKIEHGQNPTLPNYLHYALVLDVDFAIIAARARLVVRARSIGEESLP